MDIKNFFDSINHDVLKQKLIFKKCPNWLLVLVNKALSTPSKMPTEKNNSTNHVGVPQGLSIASYLADLYLEDFDKAISSLSVAYYRYVDDMIVIYKKEKVPILTRMICFFVKNGGEPKILKVVRAQLSALGLSLHSGKDKFFHHAILDSQGIDFLGYRFFITDQNKLTVSVRGSSAQKFINSLINLIIKLRRGVYDLQYGDTRKADAAFQFDINEKITGAYIGNRRYGWLWYFRQLNDLALLDKIDKILYKEMQKDVRTKQIKIKRLKRAYYEIENFNEKGNYILDYGLLDPLKIKRLYDDLDAGIKKAVSDNEILLAYSKFTGRRIKRLMLDEVRAS